MAHFETDEDYFDKHRHELKILLFDEERWEKYLQLQAEGSLCRERTRIAMWSRQIKAKRRGRDPTLKMMVSYPVKVESESRYTFVVMSDCHLEFYDAHPPQFTYKFEMMNGGSHLPADERRQAVVQGVLLLFLALFGLMYVALIMNQLKSNGSIHLVGLFLGAAYVCQTVSVFFELLHVRKYEKDGLGFRFRYSWFPLDFLSEMFQGLSEYIIMFTLLCLASGWTFSTGSMMDGSSSGQDSKGKEFFKGLKSPANVLRGKAFTAALFFGTFRCSTREFLSYGSRENIITSCITQLLYIAYSNILRQVRYLWFRSCWNCWDVRNNTEITLEKVDHSNVHTTTTGTYEDEFNSFHDHEHWPGYVCGIFFTLYNHIIHL